MNAVVQPRSPMLDGYFEYSARLKFHQDASLARAQAAAVSELPIRFGEGEFTSQLVFVERRLIPDGLLEELAAKGQGRDLREQLEGERVTQVSWWSSCESTSVVRLDGIPGKSGFGLFVASSVKDDQEIEVLLAWAIAIRRLDEAHLLYSDQDADELGRLILRSVEVAATAAE